MSEMTQQILPEVVPPPTLTQLTELELANYRSRIIEANGDIEVAGITLDEMRNIIYTCRRKANPMAEAEGLPASAKKSTKKAPSTNVGKISGDDVNNFLG